MAKINDVSLPEKYVCIDFKPRFRDTDQVGHVNNAVYLSYFEMARVEWYTQVKKEMKESTAEGFNFILARAEIDYILPILMHQEYQILMWTDKIGNKSWTIKYLICNKERTKFYAKGSTIQVAYDYKVDKTVMISDAGREILKRIYSE